MAAAEETRPDEVSMEEIVALCKRRGFVFPSSEIYGGLGSTYDYGHYGVLLKNNVKAEWWRAMIQERDDIVALDSAILQHPKVWEASGHLAGFTDPMVDCRTCKLRFRADKLEDGQCGKKPSKKPGEGPDCDLTEPRQFNLMFETHVGPVAGEGSEVYLRPETAQGIFINFKNVLQFARRKPPFGIAQVGKSFRNEITPGNFIFRTREFEQMEMEFFVPPDDAERWYRTWIDERERWYTELGIRPDHLRVRPHDDDELSHYSSGTSDVEYLFPIGWSELEGIANRGDFDLTQHAKFSGEKLEYFDQQTKESYVPHVIEPAAGADRATLAFLVDSYDDRGGRGTRRAPSCASTPASPRSRWRSSPSSPKRACPRRPARSTTTCAASSRPSTTRAARSASATAARTRSAPPGASPSTARRWRTTPSPSATATPSSRPESRSRDSATSWPGAWSSPGAARSWIRKQPSSGARSR